MNNSSVTDTCKEEGLFCRDLPSKPLPHVGTILVTGASGHVGGRLVPELLARGYKVRVMLRGRNIAYKKSRWTGAEIVIADALNEKHLKTALDGIDTAYYLIHSLRLGSKSFEAADIRASANFRKVADEKHVKRLIYLGGLEDIRSSLSSHLGSRIEVARELKKGKTPITVLRAAVIVGKGSASYEIMQYLVKRLPVIPFPHQARNKCQPVAISDVIKYLVGVLEVPETAGKDFDIGGKDILTYVEMLKVLAGLLDKRTIFVPFPFLNIGLYTYLAGLLTPIPNSITRCLVEGLKNEAICHDESIKKYFPFEPMSYKEAVLRTILHEKQDNVPL
jgi:uncharacterized protein YbjT (DUF2867 family)